MLTLTNIFLNLILLLNQEAAVNSTGNLSMELFATYHAIGLDIQYTGDENNNLAAEFFYRVKGAKDWQEGVDMTLIRERKRIYASAFRFEQGQIVEIKVLLKDPDGVSQQELNGVTTIKTLVTANKQSNKKYVSNRGSDSNPGSEIKPFKTINRALKNLQPGDEIIIQKGIYQEELSLNGVEGTAGKPIIIRGATTKPATALDIKWHGKDVNADFTVLTSLKSISKKSKWSRVGDDLYSISIADLRINDRGSSMVMMDDKELYVYKDFETLKAAPRDNIDKKGYEVELDLTGKIRGDDLEALPAWAYDINKQLFYVRLLAGDTPEKHEFKYTSLDYGITLTDCKNIIIRDLDIGYYASHGIRLQGDSDNNIIYNNLVHHAPINIYMMGTNNQEKAMDGNVLWGNNVFKYGSWQYTWRAMMASKGGYHGINIRTVGRGNVAIENSIHNVFNALNVTSAEANDAYINVNRDFDLIDNLCYNIGDDSWEPDGGAINMRVLHNRSINALELISLAPVKLGPVYVVGNVGVSRLYGFKFVYSQSGSGHVYLYHNVSIGIGNGTKAYHFPPNEYVFENKVAKNNIFVFSSDATISGRTEFDNDYNCYYRYGPKSDFSFRFSQPKKSFTLSEMQKEIGKEVHGIAGEPGFKSPITITAEDIIAAYKTDKILAFDFTLKAGSICIDKGLKIRGINAGFWGAAPDIGAQEYKK